MQTPSSSILDNREIAILIWLAIVVGWMVRKPAVRESGLQVLKTIFCRKLMALWAIEILYVAIIAISLNGWGLWSIDNLKSTIVWFFSAAIVMTCTVVAATPDQANLIKALRGGFTITVFVEFAVNAFAFPLLVELVAVPVIAMLTVVSVLIEMTDKFKPLRGAMNALLSIVGLLILLYFSYRLWDDFDAFARADTAIEFFLPLVMLILYIPFLFGFTVYCAYENAFVRLKVFMDDPPLRRFTKRTLLLNCRSDYARVSRWWKLYMLDRPRTKDGIRDLVRQSKRDVSAVTDYSDYSDEHQ